MAEKFSLSELFAESAEVFREHRAMALGMALAMGVGFFALDQVSETGGSFVATLVGVVVQYLFLQKVLGAHDAGEKPRYGSMFGANLLSGLGIVIGLIALVVPGLFLAARWTLSPAFIVADGSKATESLSQSWRATAECWVPIMLGYLIFYVPFIALILGAEIAADAAPKFASSAATNLGYGFSNVALWILVSATYRLVSFPNRHLSEVFG